MKFNAQLHTLIVFLCAENLEYCIANDEIPLEQLRRQPCLDNVMVNEDLLIRQNHIRESHKSPPLQLDPQLMIDSMSWAQTLALRSNKMSNIKHGIPPRDSNNIYSNPPPGYNYVESIYMLEKAPNRFDNETLKTAIEAWYNSKNWKSTGEENDRDLHERMVKKTTKKLGCAACYSRAPPMIWVVCRYISDAEHDSSPEVSKPSSGVSYLTIIAAVLVLLLLIVQSVMLIVIGMDFGYFSLRND